MNDFENMNFDDLFSDFATSASQEPKKSSVVEVQSNNTAATKIEEKVANIATEQINAYDGAKKAYDLAQLVISGVDKMNKIGAELNNEFVERDDVIKLLQLAIVSKTNALLLGPPGTAKTKITHNICSRIVGSNYFEWMMNKTSDPSEILGSFSVKQMENDKFMRVTKGKLPEAHIAFLDEVYKSNAPCLNAILTIMNEHIFYNDGVAVDIPLISLVGASNEPPEDESLAALHDRFIFRINVSYVTDAGNKKKMHNNYINERNPVAFSAPKTTITLEEIEALNTKSKQVIVSKDIINQFIRLISSLGRNAIHVSDRRQNECFKVMQSAAVLAGRDRVVLDDFLPLVYVLWEEENQIPVIREEITKLINPYDDKINEVKANFEQIRNDINKINNQNDKMRKCIEAKPALDKLVSKVNKLINDASRNGKDVAAFMALRDEIVQFSNSNVQESLGAVLGIDGIATNMPSTSTTNAYTFTTTTTATSPFDLNVNNTVTSWQT